MTADLDPFFAALRQDGDAVPTGVPEVARRRGRSRTLRTVAGAAVGVLVLVGGVGVAVRGGGGTDPDIAPQPVASTSVPGAIVPFGPLQQIGQAIATTGTARFSTIPTSGDRAFVGRQTEDGTLSVTAVDLNDAKVVWGPKTIATFGDAAYLMWHPKYVIASGRHDNGTRPDGSLTVLDQGSGKQLMRIDVDNFEADHVLLGESLLIIDSRPDRTIRAYELATGKVRWSLPDGGSPTVHLMSDSSSAALAAVNTQRGQYSFPNDYGFTRIVQVTADGTAIVRDALTSREISRHSKATDPAGTDMHDDMTVIDGVLYAARVNASTLLRATELRPGGTTRQLYTNDATTMHSMAPCGERRLCFVESLQGTQDQPALYGLVSIDTADGKVAWRQNTDPQDVKIVNGLALVSGYGREEASSQLFDGTGRQLLNAAGSKGLANWVDANALLLFALDGEKIRVSGISPVTAGPVALGTIEAGQGCGWTTSRLICATGEGIKVWRFTK